MDALLKWSAVAALGSVAIVGVFACRSLQQERIDEHAIASSILSTVANVNRPCAGKAGPDACGTLAQLSKTAIDVGRIAITLSRKADQMDAITAQSVKTIAGIASDVHTVSDSAALALDATAQTAQGATKLLATANDAVAVNQPKVAALIGHADGAVVAATTVANNANAAMPYITATMHNAADATAAAVPLIQNANGIVADGRVQADRLTYPTPQPWYKRIGHFALGSGKLAYDFYFR